LLEEWKSSVLNLNLQKWQLKKEISLVYNDLKYLDEKKKLLKKADSIFTQYYNRAELRLKKGESNLLEKATAENLKSQANMQLKALEKDKEIALQKLNYLINDGTFYQNEKGKTNKWLAEKLGKSDVTVSRWVTNEVQPSMETLLEIAKLLDVDIKELLNSTK
jgi:DNA-binding XRE family transcriptional regulator